MTTRTTRKEKVFKNMLMDHKNINNVCGIPNTPVGRSLPKKAAVAATPTKKKEVILANRDQLKDLIDRLAVLIELLACLYFIKV